MFLLSPIHDNSGPKSLEEIYLGSNSINILQIACMLNINNIGQMVFHFNAKNTYPGYYPKVYSGTLSNLAEGWIVESTSYGSTWPEIN